MKYRAEFGGVREGVWSRNGLEFDTVEEATDYAFALLARWTGADIARVVPTDTPDREAVDMADPAIVVSYR